jgi:F0F1-type ATP synthase assembly protein I
MKERNEAEQSLQENAAAAYAEKTAHALVAVLRLQTVVAVLLALGLLLMGPVAAYSSLCGSLAVYIPGMLFTVLLARKMGGSSTSFLGTAAVAEFGKLFLTGLLCALVFIWVKPLEPVWFFVGMLTVLATSWIGLAKAIS